MNQAGFPIFTCLLLAGMLLLAAACSSPQGKAEDGSRWYAMYRCSGCHGEDGRGGKAPQLAGYDGSFRSFKGKIRNSKSSIMPSYAPDRVTDQDIADMFAYLQTSR